MKILGNLSVLSKGGSFQLASMLVHQALEHSDHQWRFAVSGKAYQQLIKSCPEGKDLFDVFETSPARSRASRRRLSELESSLKSDCVFTLAGPAYVRFRSPHLLGFVNPWVSHPTRLAYSTLSFPGEWLYTRLDCEYKRYWFRQADGWVTETESARQGIHRQISAPLDKIGVVPNNRGPLYYASEERTPFPAPDERISILCFAASYRHKRLTFVPQVAKYFASQNPDLDFRFVMTIPEDDPIWKEVLTAAKKLGVEDKIDNIGPVAINDGPDLYRSCHICFMPTVLETFSATYPEAMAMGLPIVSTDLAILRDVCQDAALYFEPTSAQTAAARMSELLQNQTQWEELVERGKQRLQQFPTPAQRYRYFVALLESMVAGKPIYNSNTAVCTQTIDS